MESTDNPRPLLQRPESAGVGVMDFSFTKPVSHKKPFSLRNISNQSAGTRHSTNNGPGSADSAEDAVVTTRPSIVPDTPLSFRNRDNESNSNGQASGQQSLFPQSDRWMSMVADSSEGRTTAPAPGNSRNPITERERLIAISNSSELGQSPDPEVAPDAAANIIPPGQGITDLCKASEDGCAVNKAIPIQQLQSRRESREVSDHSSRAPLKPVNSQPRALKTGHSIVKEAPSKKQTASTSGKRNVQLSEDDLFEQLIVKMRQREESEQNATNMQRQMQTENQDLKESNHLLQDRVKKYQAQLAKLSSETKNQRAQIDQWKTRLGAFRGIINELGREYDKVREQTKDLRETAMSLSREKGEIQSTQDDLKIQVSKHAAKFEDQRDKLSTSEGKANILREALQNSEKRGELIKEQLLSDKKRIATLESYIQRESESQARYLTVVRKEQGEMTEKLESIFGLLSESFPETQDAILSKLRPEIQRCVASVEEMKEHCVTEAMNGQGFTSTIQEAASRFESLAGQFTSGFDRSNEMSNNVFQALQEGLQSIENNFGPYSSLFKQLANSESCCWSLQRQLQAIEPTLGSLETSVKTIELSETDLIRGLKSFSQVISEARIPAGNPALEKEIATKFGENTQLQLQLQQASIEAESLRKQVSSKVSENQHLQQSLAETVEASKDRISRLEMEKTALRGELEVLEQKVRGELTTASRRSQDEMKAKFGHEIRVLQTEKDRLEQDSNSLRSQLSNVQKSLVETEKMAESDRNDKNFEELRSRIDELNESCSKYTAEAKANEANSRFSKDSEAGLRVENDNLMRELEQVKKKTGELEVELELKTQSEIMKDRAAQETERILKSLQIETAGMGEQLQSTKESLNVLKSRSAAFEKIGEETDAEIVSLLRRAQEAESWQAIIREGFVRVMKVPSGEPFEQTWQKLEDILQSSAHTCKNQERGLSIDVEENKAADTFEADLSQRHYKTGESCQAGGASSKNICSVLKPLEHEGFVDSLPKFPAGQIVPFSKFQDINSREDGLSLFNDPAELEMLMMSTPDLQGSVVLRQAVAGDMPKTIEKSGRLSDVENKEDEKKSDAALANPPVETEDTVSGWAKSALTKSQDPFGNESANSEPLIMKRKMVSFEGTRTRRMSDATDNSSGQDSDSKGVKQTNKRTYSRLRQSVAQEETLIESRMSSNLGRANQSFAGNPEKASISKADDSSENPKPPKRARNAADGPARRLSPKGLVSANSRSSAASQAAKARARTKRRTRGDRYTERFNQDAG